MPGIGPMVFRSAKAGAALWIVGVVQFVGGMIAAEWLYPNPPGYSLTQNDISDLGCCGGAQHAVIFNDSIRLLGLCVVLGALLIRTTLPSKTTARLGLAGLVLAGLAAAVVGTFPEHSAELGGNIHGIATALTFFFSGFGLVILTLAMLRDTRWRGFRTYTFLSGIVTWVAMVLFAYNIDLGLGPGGMERVVVAPVLLWGLLAGIHLLRLPTFRADAVRAVMASD